MADFETFVKAELPRRAVVLNDPPLETVLVRRGVEGPRLFEGVSLDNGELIGKVDGVIQGVSRSSLSRTNLIDIGPTSSDIVDHFLVSECISRKWVIDIKSGSDVMSFEILALPLQSKVDYSIYSILGTKLPINIEFNILNNNINLILHNNDSRSISVYSTIVK
jgi:hypothetical protein